MKRDAYSGAMHDVDMLMWAFRKYDYSVLEIRGLYFGPKTLYIPLLLLKNDIPALSRHIIFPFLCGFFALFLP
jgi:hypothetical protein